MSLELVELLLELVLRVAVLREDVRDGRVERLFHALEHLDREAFFSDLRDDRGLDLFDAHVHHGAELTLVCSADEVFVGASASGVAGVQESAGAAGVAAFAAVEQALEIVEVHDVACAVALA
nr:hypothetical protein [Microbacterium telephonicum]